ncbi:hypothetical protein QOZ80_2BG0151970 [Eleusine coracana subsp. coracana]|nr:hypothetical protein QOZ80_2BG0151970 [Eleusine coracana subsp. coracana]
MEGSIRPPAGAATPTTIRRNPPRVARPPPTPAAPSTKAKPRRLIDDEAAPPPAASSSSSAARGLQQQEEERLKVFLRIRPLPDRERDRRKDVSRPMAAKDPRRKSKQAAPGGVCLVATGPNSVALTLPQSKLADSKRGRTEVFDGFSAVFSPDSSQLDVFAQVMNPLVDDFLGGKSGLLVAMGPTGSGKTHTIFGSPRNPGILPLTLRHIFNEGNNTKVARQPTRSFSLSMFEILSEGKGEHILDLLSDAAECVLQQSTIKGLQEVSITNFVDAENLVSLGMMKRSTAATNANTKSSRSQCIITIRAVHKNIDVKSEHLPSGAVLTIADLAGAERERRTGNQGSRLLESNFINNTSMVFGLCLRALLEHQKNQKKALEKHFKNSMLTRYLRDYLEGRKKMTLVLNVKPGDDDFSDTSFLLRQASPYMKIKYTSLEDYSDLVSQKRSNVSLICQEKKKKRKIHEPEVLVVEQKENVDMDDNARVSKSSKRVATDEAQHKLLKSELRRVSRSEQIMRNFAKAFWTVLKQYKHKLLESENTTESMKELLRDKDIQIMELKRELEVLNSSCSCKNLPNVRDTPGVQDHTMSSSEAAPTLVSQANQADLSDAATDNFHCVVETEEFTCRGPKSFPTCSELKGESASGDTLVISSIHEQEQSSRDFKPEKSCCPGASSPMLNSESGNTKAGVHMVDKELDSSGNFAEETSSLSSTPPPCNHSDNQLDQGLAGHHTIPCQRAVRVSQSPQFTSYDKKSNIKQRVDESEELSMTAVDDICQDVMHPDCASSSQQVKSDTEDVSSIQSSLELQGMKNSEEVETEFERCEPTPAVDDSVLNQGCTGRPERTCPVKAPVVVKDSEAEDASVLRPDNTKRKTRRLQPVASMMLKEFGGASMEDMDFKREDRNKNCSGRCDVLIELLQKGRRTRA